MGIRIGKIISQVKSGIHTNKKPPIQEMSVEETARELIKVRKLVTIQGLASLAYCVAAAICLFAELNQSHNTRETVSKEIVKTQGYTPEQLAKFSKRVELPETTWTRLADSINKVPMKQKVLDTIKRAK
ncbi:MAG: hypothetical protein WCY19_02105 [Candidatus Gastranaerophilaceae bacterium]